MTPEQERSAFEAFAIDCPMGSYAVGREGDGYWSSHTQLMWDVWKARASLAQPASVPAGRSQHDADSANLRRLCKARDDARRERDALRAELAGMEAGSGHLSDLVDDLRGLLAESMRAMKALHESATPDDGHEMNAVIPASAFRQFVDDNAKLMHKIHVSPHELPSAQQAPQPAQAYQAAAPAHKAIEWQPGHNLFKDWCAQWFGPDADDAYLARAVAAFPAGQPTMGELPTQVAIDKAKAAMGYSQAFDGKGIDWQNDEPWPHRIELAQALDWIVDLGAVILNLADRVVPPLVITQAPAHAAATQPEAQPSIQDLAAGAHYPQVSAWGAAPSAQASPVKPDRTGLMYCKNHKCGAASAYSADCICWTPKQAEPIAALIAESERMGLYDDGKSTEPKT